MRNYFICFIAILPLFCWSQTTLPTSFDFNSPNPPLGWTLELQNGNTTYSGGSDGNPAGRLDESGDYVQIFFAEDPGQITYHIKGQTFQGAAWEGTFKIQESENGSTWSDLRILTTGSGPSTSYTEFNDNMTSTSRYLRFYFEQKIDGSNIALDEVSVLEAGPTPEQEIAVSYGGEKVITGGNIAFNSPVSSPTDITLKIENLGTVDILSISGMNISGPDAAEFELLPPTPTSINPESSEDVIIRFTPTVPGTRSALLSIDNNDANENPYLINLFGVGGDLASEPLGQPTNFSTNDVRSFMFHASFSPPQPAPDGGYLVLRKKDSPITAIPADGTTYLRGDMVGDGKVVYSGSELSFSPNHILAGSQYHFSIFAYNGAGQFTNYLTTNPLMGVVNTASVSFRDTDYYNGIYTSSSTFVEDLTQRIQPHFQVYYQNYISTMLPFSSRDTSSENKVVTCAYSGENKVYTEPFDFTTYNYSREHTFSSSWMPDLANSDSPPYSDQHNLFPTNLTEVNIPRSNIPFGNVVNVSSSYLQGQSGTDANGNDAYEPRDAQKGDVARAIFYMTTAYHGWEGTSWAWNTLTGKRIQDQDQQLLKDWHWQDPPDAWEIARNDFLDTLQENRNPFIDHPEFVCFIDFRTLQKIEDTMGFCAPAGLNPSKNELTSTEIFPNPNHGEFQVKMMSDRFQEVSVFAYDILGRPVFHESYTLQPGWNSLPIQTSIKESGVYLIKMINEQGIKTSKISIF